MALKKQVSPKRWRSKEAKEILATVQRAGGQVERTASGHLKVIGPAGSAIVASAPNTGRTGGRGLLCGCPGVVGCGGEHGHVEVGRWAVDAVPSDWGRWRGQWEFGHAGH